MNYRYFSENIHYYWYSYLYISPSEETAHIYWSWYSSFFIVYHKFSTRDAKTRKQLFTAKFLTNAISSDKISFKMSILMLRFLKIVIMLKLAFLLLLHHLCYIFCTQIYKNSVSFGRALPNEQILFVSTTPVAMILSELNLTQSVALLLM